MKNICVIGSGYVGLVTGTCFADLGNKVVTVDIDERKIAKLKQGEMPIYEPGLEELVERNVKADRLNFTTSYEEGLKDADFVFICVGTPSAVDGEADLKYVRAAAQTIAEKMTKPLIVVNKSTVPVGTGDWTADIIRSAQPTPIEFAVVSCPEFLREGSAITDFMNPDRNVFGSTDREAAEQVARLYEALGAPAVITDIRTSEMIKYASNAFLATRISFINEISIICERLGADVTEVARGMGFDKRIGPHFLNAGAGYGGSCFPKDVKALANMALIHGTHPQLLNAVMEINDFQRKHLGLKIRQLLNDSVNGKVIGMLGLAFKPNTDDIRDAPALTLARTLINQGATVRAYDPVAMENVREELPGIELVDDPYAVADGADILVLMTEWNEFKQLDMQRVKGLLKEPLLVDGRNLYKPEAMRELGFVYRGVGRGYNGEGMGADATNHE
jgi:UDPglucose 6-dehydrogenase